MVGGMESYSRDLYNSLRKKMDIDIVKNYRGKFLLPWFFVYCLYFILINRRTYSHIHLADGVLAPLGCIVKLITNARVSITIHALDIVYSNRFYQLLVPFCIKRLDGVIGVSRYAVNACISRGIDDNRCHVIPNGIDYSRFTAPEYPLAEIESNHVIKLKGKKILITVGRLIKRKGIGWFVAEVMPKLPEEFIYLIAGEGPEKQNIEGIIRKENLTGRVYLIGFINEEEKASLYDKSDLYIMPNITVPGDAEGFGISIIEAASYGLPCIAADVEGVSDAVTDGITGTLIRERDAAGFRQYIINSRFDRERIKAVTRERFDWEILAAKYANIFTEMK